MRSNSPNFCGSVTAGKWAVFFFGARALLRPAAGFRSHFPAAIANAKICSQSCRARRTVSRTPRASIRRRTPNSSGVSIAVIGRPLRNGKISRSKRLKIRAACSGTQISDCFAYHSRPIFSKVSSERSARTSLSTLRCWDGSIPSLRSFRASSQRALASFKFVSG